MRDTVVSGIKLSFPLGMVVYTPAALELIPIGLENYLRRHASCDWGDLSKEDKEQNDLALIQGERLFSSYKVPGGRIHIITEWDRSVTTILTPEDY